MSFVAVVGIIKSNATLLLSDGNVVDIDKMFDELGNETDDIQKALVGEVCYEDRQYLFEISALQPITLH